MATVWAYRFGSWRKKDYESGWSHVFYAGHMQMLLEQLSNNRLRGSVEQLSIFSHGLSGVVLMGLDKETHPEDSRESLQLSSLQRYAPSVQRLGEYIKYGGKLIFSACWVGEGVAGTAFLKAVSELLPDRIVIGYEVRSWAGFRGDLGAWAIEERPGILHEYHSGSKGRSGILTPWNRHAKWVRNLQVLRYPFLEQERRPGRRCANPYCLGHSNAEHQCRCPGPAGKSPCSSKAQIWFEAAN